MAMSTQGAAMEQAVSFVQLLNMSPRDRALAEAYAKDVYEKKSAYEEGKAEGVTEGEARGIVYTCRDFGLSMAEIIKRISLRSGCQDDEAERLYHEVVDNEKVVMA